MNTNTLTFQDETSARAFYLWWVNGGREKFEDDIAAIKAEVPGFHPNHMIEQGGEAQFITYE